jgi:hypothetical protein
VPKAIRSSPYTAPEFILITLFLRYTIHPSEPSDIAKYAADEQVPARESGGKILGYFMPIDFAGATSEAIGLIDFPSLAEYEIYGAKLMLILSTRSMLKFLRTPGIYSAFIDHLCHA